MNNKNLSKIMLVFLVSFVTGNMINLISVEASSLEVSNIEDTSDVSVFEKIENTERINTSNLYVEIRNKAAELENQYHLGNISEEQFSQKMHDEVYVLMDTEEEMQAIIVAEEMYNKVKNKVRNYKIDDGIYFGYKAREIALCSTYGNYSKCQKVKKYATHAEYYTEKYYLKYCTWEGNGDAFRHAYWSGLMAKNLGKGFAYDAGLAHENLKRGYNINSLKSEVRMDVSNNGFGRLRGADLKYKPDSVLRNNIVNHVSKGNLKRVRVKTGPNQHCDKPRDGVCTTKVGYYYHTSAGGRK